MEEKLPKFFKVMIPGFRKKLRLPPMISEKVGGREGGKRVSLMSRRGIYEVEIHGGKNGMMSFKRGWKRFVEEHKLTAGDFLVFKHAGGGVGSRLGFKVSVFDPTCCEKVFDDQTLVDTERKKKKPSAAAAAVKKRKVLTTLKPYNIRKEGAYLAIPRSFCLENGIHKSKVVTLKGPSGVEHQASLMVYQSCAQISRGWLEFTESNNLNVGDTCVFKLRRRAESGSDDIVFRVKVLRAVN